MSIRPLSLLVPAGAILFALAGCAASGERAIFRRIDLLGTPIAAQAGQRTITIAPDTAWVNVTAGETVRFIVDGRSFAWNFQVSDTVTMFELNRIAPPGMLARRIAVYVAPNPLYISNS